MKGQKYETATGKPAPTPKGANVENGLSEHYMCDATNNTLGANTESSKQKPAMEKAKGGFEFYGN